eukprot:5390575-Heterocapsa_arctica.AAC.1
MERITADTIRRVVNRVVNGKAKRVDGWSLAELRALSQTHTQGLSAILNNIEKVKKWPEGVNPIIAIIPKDGAGNEGQLRPIAILRYIYRVWMAVRKRRVKHWAMQLNNGGLSSPETLVCEIAARGELA